MKEKPQALLLMRLRVQNANAISGPLTWGFPPPSAFTGFVHALNLRIKQDPELATYQDLSLDGAGVICHRFEPQTYTPAGKRTQVFALTRNPLDKDGSTSAIVEEGRAHLELSLVVGLYGDELDELSKDSYARLASCLYHHACAMRLAGGSIQPVRLSYQRLPALVIGWPDGRDQMKKATRDHRQWLLPGFALIHREDALAKRLAELQDEQAASTALDAVLDLSRLNFECKPVNDEELPESSTQTEWSLRRKNGWLVPLPIGYAALSEVHPAGTVKNARDKQTPFCFVESVLSLGEWRSPHRIDNLLQLLWFHHAQPEAGLYTVHQPFAAKTSTE